MSLHSVVPLWLFFFISLAIVTFFVSLGHRYAMEHRQRDSTPSEQTPVDSEREVAPRCPPLVEYLRSNAGNVSESLTDLPPGSAALSYSLDGPSLCTASFAGRFSLRHAVQAEGPTSLVEWIAKRSAWRDRHGTYQVAQWHEQDGRWLSPAGAGAASSVSPQDTDPATGALAILLDEHSNGADIGKMLDSLEAWPHWIATIPWFLFYVEGTLSPETAARIERATAASGTSITTVPVTQEPPAWATDHRFGGVGYQWCSDFLTAHMYCQPTLQRFHTLVRIDEDVYFEPIDNPPVRGDRYGDTDIPASARDSFAPQAPLRLVDHHLVRELADTQCLLGQLVRAGQTEACPWVCDQLLTRATAFANDFPAIVLPDAIDRLAEWKARGFPMHAGWAEIYHMDVFRNPLFWLFIQEVDYLDGYYRRDWREMTLKSAWVVLTIPTDSIHWGARDLWPEIIHKFHNFTLQLNL
mmetsp:Transcript_3736/g.12097  ORF Transcript_3736/g.12097 Transcript_3736/m.12097 type:complete len:467 (-) Transcript_3736:110-1510(-)